MRYPHRIRLRGPWELEVLSMGEGQPAPASSARITWPFDWGDSLGFHFRGRVRLRRFFNCPTGLDGHESVWLVVEGKDLLGEISLNGQPLGPGDAAGDLLCAMFDVTGRLEPRSELWIDLEFATAGVGNTLHEVRLEIRAKQ